MGWWRVRFCTTDQAVADESLNRASIYVFQGDIELRLRDEGQVFRPGRTGSFVIELVTLGAVVVSLPEFVPEPSLTLMVDGEDIPVPAQNADGTWSVNYAVPAGFPRDEIELTGSITASIRLGEDTRVIELTKSPILPLGSIQVSDLPRYPLINEPIPAFEVIDQNHLKVTSTVVISAVGPVSGGCVTLVAIGPPAQDDYPVQSVVRVLDSGALVVPGTKCALELDTGETRELIVEVSVDRDNLVNDGKLTSAVMQGHLEFISTSSLDPSDSETFEKRFTVTTQPLIDTAVSEKTVWLALAFALAVPILLLYILNFWSARLEVTEAAYANISVRLSGRRLLRITDGGTAPLELEDTDLEITRMPRPGRFRRVKIQDAEFSGHVPAWPLSDVSGRVSCRASAFVVASKGTTKSGHQGKIDASLVGAWVFWSPTKPTEKEPGSGSHDSDRLEPLDGQLLIVVPIRPERAQEYFHQVRYDLTEAILKASEMHAVTATLSEPPSERVTDVADQAGHATSNSDFTGHEDPFGVAQSLPTSAAPEQSDRKGRRPRRGDDDDDGSTPSLPPPDPAF